MNYLKYIFLVIGLGLIMCVQISFTQRSKKVQNRQLVQKERLLLNIGYGCCAIAVILVLLFN